MALSDTSTGQIILQAAQGISRQAVARQQLEIQKTEQLREAQQQQRTFAFREEEMAIRERTVGLQEEQFKRSQALDVLRTQEQELDIKLKQRRLEQAGPPGLTPGQVRLRRRDSAQLAEQTFGNILVENFEQRTGRTGLPRLGTATSFEVERRRINNAVDDIAGEVGKLSQTLRVIQARGGPQVERIEGELNRLSELQVRNQSVLDFMKTNEFKRFALGDVPPQIVDAADRQLFGDQVPIVRSAREFLDIKGQEDLGALAFTRIKPEKRSLVISAIDQARSGIIDELEQVANIELTDLPPAEANTKIANILRFIDFSITDPDESARIRRELIERLKGSR